MGDLAVSSGSGGLTASGIGSCLVITLYDAVSGAGALAHAMLPHDAEAEDGAPRDAKYVDSAISKMLEQLFVRGAKRDNIQAKIVGGANMFPSTDSDIGAENVNSARKELAEEGIALVAESVGGTAGRSVELCTLSGVVTVKTKL